MWAQPRERGRRPNRSRTSMRSGARSRVHSGSRELPKSSGLSSPASNRLQSAFDLLDVGRQILTRLRPLQLALEHGAPSALFIGGSDLKDFDRLSDGQSLELSD